MFVSINIVMGTSGRWCWLCISLWVYVTHIVWYHTTDQSNQCCILLTVSCICWTYTYMYMFNTNWLFIEQRRYAANIKIYEPRALTVQYNSSCSVSVRKIWQCPMVHTALHTINIHCVLHNDMLHIHYRSWHQIMISNSFCHGSTRDLTRTQPQLTQYAAVYKTQMTTWCHVCESMDRSTRRNSAALPPSAIKPRLHSSTDALLQNERLLIHPIHMTITWHIMTEAATVARWVWGSVRDLVVTITWIHWA